MLPFTITEKIEEYEDGWIGTTADERGNETQKDLGSLTNEEQQKIMESGIYSRMSRKRAMRKEQPDKEGYFPKNSYLESTEILKKLGVDLFTDDEPGKNNIGSVYTDGDVSLSGLENRPLALKDKENILKWMQEENYSHEAIRSVNNSFERLFLLE